MRLHALMFQLQTTAGTMTRIPYIFHSHNESWEPPCRKNIFARGQQSAREAAHDLESPGLDPVSKPLVYAIGLSKEIAVVHNTMVVCASFMGISVYSLVVVCLTSGSLNPWKYFLRKAFRSSAFSPFPWTCFFRTAVALSDSSDISSGARRRYVSSRRDPVHR
jgi:hypothetical protein